MPSIRDQLKSSREHRKLVFPQRVTTTENGKSIQVFKRNSADFSPTFLKYLKSGQISTPIHNSALVTATEPTKKRNKRFVQQETNKDMIKSVVGSRESYQVVDIHYKCVYFNSETSRWVNCTMKPIQYKLSIPILNNLIQYASSRRQSTLLYKFKTGENEGGEPILDYTPIEHFLKSIQSTCRTKNALKTDLKQLSSTLRAEEMKHNKDDTKLEVLKNKIKSNKSLLLEFSSKFSTKMSSGALVQDLDKICFETDKSITSDSFKLIGLECVVRSEEFEATGIGGVNAGDIPQADERQAKHFTTNIIENDITNDHEIHPDAFKKRTGIVFCPNSCLATIVLYSMFRDNAESDETPRVRWIQGVKVRQSKLLLSRSEKIEREYGVKCDDLSYDLISRVTEVNFLPDGSLRLTFNEMEKFLKLYSQPMMVQNPLGRKLYEFKPKLIGKEETRPVIMSVSHQNHTRMVGNSQQEAQTFQHAFKKSKNSNDLIESTTNRCQYNIRTEFDNPLMVLTENTDHSMEEIAETLVKTIIEENDKHEMELMAREEESKKGKKKRYKKRNDFNDQKYLRIHFVGDAIERLLLILKENHHIIAGNLKIGQGNSIKTFDIRHKKTLMCVGNLCLSEQLMEHELKVQTIITNLDHMKLFNEWYGNIYKNLFRKEHLTKYGENWVEIAWGLRCQPLGFSEKTKRECIGSFDVNKSYTHLLANEMKDIPVFDAFCDFLKFNWDKNIDSLEDNTFYIIKRIENKEYSASHSIIMDKTFNMYCGKLLKEAKELLPSLDFDIISHCEPKSAVSVDFAPIITELYDGSGSKMPTQQKKFVINCLLGCLDQNKRTKRSAEWYEDVDEARANNTDDYFNPTILTTSGSEWQEDIERRELEKQIESLNLKLEFEQKELDQSKNNEKGRIIEKIMKNEREIRSIQHYIDHNDWEDEWNGKQIKRGLVNETKSIELDTIEEEWRLTESKTNETNKLEKEIRKRDCNVHSIQYDIRRKQDELERKNKVDYLEKLEWIIACEKGENKGKRYNTNIIDEIESLQNLVNVQGLDDELKDKILYHYWNWQNYKIEEEEEKTDKEDEFDEFDIELDADLIESLNKYEQSPSKHEEADSWRRYTSEELKARKHIYIVQTKKTTHHMTDGFLPVALLKYQLQRLVVLRMWKRIEDSADHVPIGVKTDCIFVSAT